jgi:hypothetical protein
MKTNTILNYYQVCEKRKHERIVDADECNTNYLWCGGSEEREQQLDEYLGKTPVRFSGRRGAVDLNPSLRPHPRRTIQRRRCSFTAVSQLLEACGDNCGSTRLVA